MNTEELLKPRYKVIARFPAMSHVGEDGFILDSIIYPEEKHNGYYYNGYNVATYPHLFKKLEWWEEREEKDMPKYLKSSRWVAKIIHYDLIAGLFRDEDFEKHGLETQIRTYLPATEEEFLAHTKIISETELSEG